MKTNLAVFAIWLTFPFNALVNLRRGYSLRTSWMLHRVSARWERGAA